MSAVRRLSQTIPFANRTRRRVGFRLGTIAFNQCVQTVRGYLQPAGHIGYTAAIFNHLLDCLNLKFFRLPFAA